MIIYFRLRHEGINGKDIVNAEVVSVRCIGKPRPTPKGRPVELSDPLSPKRRKVEKSFGELLFPSHVSQC